MWTIGQMLLLSLIMLDRMVYVVEASDGAVMMALTYDIGDRFLVCQKQMYIANYAKYDLGNYWNSSYTLKYYGTGCAIFCIMYGLQFVNDYGFLQPQNADGYLRAHGAGTPLVNKLLDVADQCKQQIIDRHITDVCTIALEAGICFRTAMFEIGLVPDEIQYRRDFHVKGPRCRRSLKDIDDEEDKDIKDVHNATFYARLKAILGLG